MMLRPDFATVLGTAESAATAADGYGGDVQTLRDRVAGRIVLPGDYDWDTARQAWNLAVDQQPESG